jgi:hypothetical protein
MRPASNGTGMIVFTTSMRYLVGFLLTVILPGYLLCQAPAFAEEFDQCGIESSIAFEDWKQWAKTASYFSSEHGNRWVTIYFDGIASTLKQSTNGEFPICAKIIKVHHSYQGSSTIRKLFLMTKMPVGFDPEHGDWWYGNYNAKDGMAMIEQGAVKACIDCHQKASTLDYVFSKPSIANAVN